MTSRRALLQQAGLGLLGYSLLPAVLRGPALRGGDAVAPKKSAAFAPLNRFPRSVQEYQVRRAREIEQAANARRAALRSKSDAEAYVRDVRQKIQRSFGPWPAKTPLNPRVTGMVERDTYRIEKVIFDSRPNFPVTANLYVPKGRAFPLPGVVGSCGHTANAKASEAYQSFAQGLARQGYVVLLFDPIGQGERMQFLTASLEPRRDLGLSEHAKIGNQQLLVGEFFGSWRAWDGIRALDYLLTRPEVDPQHVGVTGNSGGGTMTTWLCGVEPRWTMAAPSCFVTTFRRNLENELPADAEQCPPQALALGLDHSDFIAALAPKPVILLGQERDFFDARGLEEAFARLQHLYRLLGAEQNIGLFIGPDGHGYHRANREAMYRWFNDVTKVSDARNEPALTIEKDETLWCTPHGQIGRTGARTVFSFMSELSRSLHASRGQVGGAALLKAVRAGLNLPSRPAAPEYRILRPLRSRGYPKEHAAAYAVETEPGIFAVVYQLHDAAVVSRPPRGPKRALLYVSHRSADEELRKEPLLRELMRTEPQAAVFTCDVRGIGESQPNTTAGRHIDPYGTEYFHAMHASMLGFPYPGQRTHDVLGVIDWLKANGIDDVHLVGNGWGAVPATFAALLSDAVTQVTLKHALTSYRDVAESEDYGWPLSSYLPGVLKVFDLPDCYRALESKQLRQIEARKGSDRAEL